MIIFNTAGLSEPGMNDNEEVLLIHRSIMIGNSTPNSIQFYIQESRNLCFGTKNTDLIVFVLFVKTMNILCPFKLLILKNISGDGLGSLVDGHC